MTISSDGAMDGIALEVTVASHGFEPGHRFTSWKDVPEGVPLRLVDVMSEEKPDDEGADGG